MKTARKIFLWVGIILLVITFIVCVTITVEYYTNAFHRALEYEDLYKGGVVSDVVLVFLVMLMPVIIIELTLMRNGYVFLTPGAPKGRTIRCIVSSVLVLWVIIVGILLVLGYLDFKNHLNGYRMKSNFLFSLLPTAIIALALGKKTRAKEIDSI